MENNNPPIRFFEMLGLSEEELSEYAIRLNQSSGAWFDAMTMYYEHHDELMDWVFTRRWNGSKAGGNIRQPKVLQFIQLDGREKPAIHWLFIGGYEVGETVMQGMTKSTSASQSNVSSHSRRAPSSCTVRGAARRRW